MVSVFGDLVSFLMVLPFTVIACALGASNMFSINCPTQVNLRHSQEMPGMPAEHHLARGLSEQLNEAIESPLPPSVVGPPQARRLVGPEFESLFVRAEDIIVGIISDSLSAIEEAAGPRRLNLNRELAQTASSRNIVARLSASFTLTRLVETETFVCYAIGTGEPTVEAEEPTVGEVSMGLDAITGNARSLARGVVVKFNREVSPLVELAAFLGGDPNDIFVSQLLRSIEFLRKDAAQSLNTIQARGLASVGRLKLEKFSSFRNSNEADICLFN